MKHKIFLWSLSLVVLFSSCNKRFDDHNAVNDPMLSEQLLSQINKNPELSKFSEYLVKTGYDQVLASSKTFTVWAPTNQALQNLDPTVINTDAKLKLFIGNHIANQSFVTTALKQAFIRVKTLNGKNVTFTSTSVDGSPLASKDVFVGNGVLNTITTAITPKVSAWEYLMSTTTSQSAELKSLSYSYYDYSKAEVVSIDPKKGTPVYKPGTGIISTNRFLDQVYADKAGVSRKPQDISNEDSTFTYIVLTDAAFLAEKNKLSQYYKLGAGLVGLQDSTDSVTKFNVIKDLSFKGLLDKDNFPATTYSQGDSVKFHLDKNAVVQTINVSNGVVYVMSSLNYELGNGTYDVYTKIKPIVLEGESATVFLSSKTNTKPVRSNPDGSTFTQLSVVNPATASYWAKYTPDVVNSVKYKVYWRVVRETNMIPVGKASAGGANADLVYSPQRLGFKATTLLAAFPYVAKPGVVPVLGTDGKQKTDLDGKNIFAPDYSEIYLNDYTVDKYYSGTMKSGAAGRFPVYLIANTSATNGVNDLLLDYVRLVPVP